MTRNPDPPTRPPERHDEDHSDLDALLSAPQGHIPDEGFTERVMARLPETRPAPHPAWRWAILTLFGLLGAAIGLVPLLGAQRPLGLLVGGDRLADALWHVMTWSPALLPTTLPVVPLLLAASLLAGALAHAHSRA
jgi:hypothetical protein